jgi:hypothetical protein
MGKQATAIVVYKSYIYMNSTGEKKKPTSRFKRQMW